MSYESYEKGLPQTPDHQDALTSEDWGGPSAREELMAATTTPDVPTRRGMGRRMLDKLRDRTPDMVTLDAVKDKKFTTESRTGTDVESLTAFQLEQEDVAQAHAENEAWGAASQEQAAEQLLIEQQEILSELERKALPSNHLSFEAQTEADRQVAEQKGYIAKLRDRVKESSGLAEDAQNAAFTASQHNELQEAWKLEDRKKAA